MAAIKQEHVRPNPFTMSDIDISKYIIGIHDSFLTTRYDVLSLYNILVNLIKNSTHTGDSIQQKLKNFKMAEVVEDRIPHGSIMPPAHTLKEIACEMRCHSFNAQDTHETVVWILEKLRSYSWDAKAVTALAAFVMDYGELWRLSFVQHATESSSRLEVHLFKFGQDETSREAYLEQYKTLVDPTLQLIRSIIELEDLINDKIYTRKDVPTLYTVHQEIYTYWAIFALLACASHMTELEWSIKASEVVRKVNLELTNLNMILQECKTQIDALKDYKWRLWIFQNPSGVLELLKALIYPRDYMPMNIFDKYNKTVVSLDVLKSKHLLLFISPFDNIEDEILALRPVDEAFKRDPDKQDYSILWVPVVDNWNEENMAKFESLRSHMPWYVTKYFSLVKGIRPLKEEWFYHDKPIVVVVNPRGVVINKNAMHMIFVWKIEAFPFHPDIDETLPQHWQLFWDEDGQLTPSIGSWIEEGKFIFYYGGHDKDWIQQFTMCATALANHAALKQANISIEVVHVEKKHESFLHKFWKRIENWFMTKIHKTKEDKATKEMQKILSYKNESGWALLSNGSSMVDHGHGITILKTLAEFEQWRENVMKKGFEISFKEYHEKVVSNTHYNTQLEIPFVVGKLPDTINCPVCPRRMDIAISCKCCHTDNVRKF